MEELDLARARLETRLPLIEEALAELPRTEDIKLENYLGYGRSLRINDNVREALHQAAEEEIVDLKNKVEELRGMVMARREALAGLPS